MLGLISHVSVFIAKGGVGFDRIWSYKQAMSGRVIVMIKEKNLRNITLQRRYQFYYYSADISLIILLFTVT